MIWTKLPAGSKGSTVSTRPGIFAAASISQQPPLPQPERSPPKKGLFDWIVSDFGLNDAIEAGLVKTPRVVVRDDALANAQTYRSKLYHLYNEAEVKEDLNRKAEPHEPLPDLVQNAYTLLAY